MKWFKHISDSLDDPDISESVVRFGADGYLVFFRTLEVMAREFDENQPGVNQFSVEVFRKKFPYTWPKTRRILEYFSAKKRIIITLFHTNGLEHIRLECPKLRELSDIYTKRLVRSKFEHECAHAEHTGSHHRSRREKQKEKEKENKNPEACGPGDDADIPFDQIVEAYHQELPDLPHCSALTKTRKAFVRHRWSEDDAHQNVEWWRGYFQSVNNMPHLKGDNERGWTADFEWLVRPSNMLKVLEGRYLKRPRKVDPYGRDLPSQETADRYRQVPGGLRSG